MLWTCHYIKCKCSLPKVIDSKGISAGHLRKYNHIVSADLKVISKYTIRSEFLPDWPLLWRRTKQFRQLGKAEPMFDTQANFSSLLDSKRVLSFDKKHC